MKKGFLCVLLLTMLVLSTGASAAHSPTGAVEEEFPGELVTTDAGKRGFSIPIEYADRYLNILINDISQFPFSHVYGIMEKDTLHNSYGFYSSKGCTDITCTAPAHVHWCPARICQDMEHGHSAAEYSEIVNWNPQCPCHRR